MALEPLSLPGIGQVFHIEIRQQVPALCGSGTLAPQPFAFSLSHRVMTKCVFLHQPGASKQ